MLKKQIRTSILNVIKSALKIKILESFFLYLFYFFAIIYLFYYINWWNTDNLKDTIIWFTFSGLPIGFVVAVKKLECDFWKNLILKNLKLMVLVEFIINSFTFSLVVELFLIPFIIVITALNALSKHKIEYKPVEKLTNIILMFFGFIVLFHSLDRAIVEIHSIENMNTLKSILLPVVYSIISVPYMYILKLYVEYENDAIIRKYNNPLSKGSVKSGTAQTRAIQIIPVATQKPKLSANTSSFETTLQFSDSKKEELAGYMTEFYDAKEAKVIFIPPSNTSSNGLIAIDYYTAVTPTRTDIHNFFNGIM